MRTRVRATVDERRFADPHRIDAQQDPPQFPKAFEDALLHVRDAVPLADRFDSRLNFLVLLHGHVRPKVMLNLVVQPAMDKVVDVAAATVTGWLTFSGALALLAPVVPVALLVIAIKSSMAIRNGIDDRAGMTKAIEGTLAIHTIGSIWLLGCMLYMHWWG